MFKQYKDVLGNLGQYSKDVFKHGYVKMLFAHMKTWSKTSWMLIIANFIIQVLLAWQGFGTTSLAQTILGFLGANLSVMCVVGISNKAPIQGWFGATSAICIIASALLAHNFADATIQLGYLIFLDVFCILSPEWNNNVKVHKMGDYKQLKAYIEWVKYLSFFAIVWLISYYAYKNGINDPRPFLDSGTFSIGVTGALMEFNLLREQYIIWTLSSVLTIGLWVQTAMQGDANYALVASYSIFLLNDLWAFFSAKGWFRGDAIKEANETSALTSSPTNK